MRDTHTHPAPMSRRDFMRLSSLGLAGLAAGCATNPVTGQSQLMLLPESAEISLDKKNSPHQFSADYGELQDKALNRYISDMGQKIAALSHRPHMPYSFRGVNAAYVNAYAFPGGSVAATRGILLVLENEAELAGLMGHEIGHVNARHTAERMTKGLLLTALIQGAALYAGTRDESVQEIVTGLGGIGAGMLLAKYSRDDERQADDLGMRYMEKAGWNPNGMTGLMERLLAMSSGKPNVIERMFSSHPMSRERRDRARQSAARRYGAWPRDSRLGKERYMDHTAGLRKIKGAVESLWEGEKEMAKKRYSQAEAHYEKALKIAPDDYAGLLMMSKCQLAQKRPEEARRYAEKAKAVNPGEPQALHVDGLGKLMAGRFQAAHADFAAYERALPGNADTIFLKARSLEGMGDTRASAREYARFLQSAKTGGQARYAHQRLVDWGHIQKQ
ncbi:Peptidase M48 Ste24p [Candidatus Desulfarcum epimagneticum]|uniref:Peptidase M48 Ste24p n=1 Tax=uncultured Desulfobacteraceae bacterium TaxID=218296 RepID=A0A484HHI2_9BACT|nr:Peptidase M48 Ste24p [uncultured Desulfobacteraceae bacterium]